MAQALEQSLGTDMPGGYETVLSAKPKTMQEITGLKAESVKGYLGDTREEQEAKSRQAQLTAEETRKYREREAGMYKQIAEQKEKELGQAPIPAFTPTKDNAQDIANLFGLIGVIGMVLGHGGGRQSAMGAMNAMTGMMNGYSQGRKDLYYRERDEFEKNFKIMKAKHEEILQKFNDAVKAMPYNLAGAKSEMEQAIAASGSDVLKATYKTQGWQKTLDLLNNTGKDLQHVEAIKSSERQGELNRANALKIAQMKIDAKKVTGAPGVSLQGVKSAINERYQNTVIRAANEVLRGVELVEKIGKEKGGGALGTVFSKGTISTAMAATLAGGLTSEQQRNYNTAMAGLALELSYVMNGGYKPDVGTVQKLETNYRVGPADSRGNAAYKMADMISKLKAALEVSPSYTEEQKTHRDNILRRLEKYDTPENVLDKWYGGGKDETYSDTEKEKRYQEYLSRQK